MLCGETRCDVVVYNDVVPGIISFADNEVKVKQSDENIKIPVIRSQRTSGKFFSFTHSKNTILS